ncbi:MAG: BrnT family toxin [Gammaproteobacteria bacterium]|nr:BrnT family toxin [Gammaproteobacteria bacterium]
MQFEWDGIKAESNKDKHQGVTFDEAVSCFFDPDQIAFYDPDHSDDEDREILVGHSDLGRLLAVSYTLRNDAIRIISARKATHREIEDYARTI